MSNKKNTFCNNCGKLGHLFHQCKIPITSIGVIAIRKNNNNTEVLLIRRKDSLAFVDFMRGKYNLEDKLYLINLFDKMTVSERDFILNSEFEELWKYLWGTNITNQYKNEEKSSKYKFKQLINGIKLSNDSYNLEDIINSCTENYIEPEWGFPKGRRNYQERDMICGLREFEEETGISHTKIDIILNIIPYEETFMGSNYKSYKHKYYLAYMKDLDNSHNFQKTEISNMKWMTYENALKHIRPYNSELIDIFKKVNEVLKEHYDDV